MNYRELEGVNQSTLKKILESPGAYLNAKEKMNQSQDEAEHFVFGDVLDNLLVGNQEYFENKYVVISDEDKTPPAIAAVVQDVYTRLSPMFEKLEGLGNFESVILESVNKLEYQKNWNDNTRVQKIIKEGSLYWEFLKTSSGKILLKQSLYSKAVCCKAALMCDEFTAKYVNKKLDKDVEFLDKHVITFEYRNYQCKSELDRIYINHKTKTIQPIDFKQTGTSVYSFNYDFWKFRYDFQSTFYTIALKRCPVIQKLIQDGYTLQTFLYIVVEKELKNPPLIFRVPNSILAIGKNGGILSNGKVLQGVEDAFDALEFALQRNIWNYPQYYYLKGEQEIEI